MNKSQIRIFWNINPSRIRTIRKILFPILDFIPGKGKVLIMSPDKISKLLHIKTLIY